MGILFTRKLGWTSKYLRDCLWICSLVGWSKYGSQSVIQLLFS